jgi:monoamine oxidase
MSPTYEVAVIGGGIIGLATALALSEGNAPGILVLEAEDRLAAHQTGHNSGVIHAGLYYKPGSYTARTAATTMSAAAAPACAPEPSTGLETCSMTSTSSAATARSTSSTPPPPRPRRRSRSAGKSANWRWHTSGR